MPRLYFQGIGNAVTLTPENEKPRELPGSDQGGCR
jgi:hypothetical protein